MSPNQHGGDNQQRENDKAQDQGAALRFCIHDDENTPKAGNKPKGQLLIGY
ncbi:protein of unknown function [Serratia sp. Tan611]|nr:protein of unknown function [Serratia sp. Tan611]